MGEPGVRPSGDMGAARGAHINFSVSYQDVDQAPLSYIHRPILDNFWASKHTTAVFARRGNFFVCKNPFR